jgi:hypothetical protein
MIYFLKGSAGQRAPGKPVLPRGKRLCFACVRDAGEERSFLWDVYLEILGKNLEIL